VRKRLCADLRSLSRRLLAKTWERQTSNITAFACFSLIPNFSFFLLTFLPCIHHRAEIRSLPAKGIEGKIMNLSVETKVAIVVATSFVLLIVGAMAQG